MRNSLVAVLACAYVILASACITPDDEDEALLEEALKDHEETHCPSGGGGGGHGGPGDKPARKNCADLGTYPDVESCKQCCFYNNNHVDGWECHRKKTNKANKAKEKCWREANEKMANCNRQCEWDRGGIVTINPAFP